MDKVYKERGMLDYCQRKLEKIEEREPGGFSMTKKLFIGSLPFALRQERLKEVFSEYGNVTEAVIISDKFTGRSKGFGFVTYETDEEAKAAVEGLNGKEVDGRPITVTEARPMGDRPPRRQGGEGHRQGRGREQNDEYSSDF